jgi:ABC-type molybdate transport system substrate-binding protein
MSFWGISPQPGFTQTTRHSGIAEIPAEWSPSVEYGLAMRPDAGTAVTKFRDFLLSPPARERFRDAGFDP